MRPRPAQKQQTKVKPRCGASFLYFVVFNVFEGRDAVHKDWEDGNQGGGPQRSGNDLMIIIFIICALFNRITNFCTVPNVSITPLPFKPVKNKDWRNRVLFF